MCVLCARMSHKPELRVPQFNQPWQLQQQQQQQRPFLHRQQQSLIPNPPALLPHPYLSQQNTFAHGAHLQQNARVTSQHAAQQYKSVQTAAASKPAAPARTAAQTKQLREQLYPIFDHADVDRILRNHPIEMDIQKLSSYVCDSQS